MYSPTICVAMSSNTTDQHRPQTNPDHLLPAPQDVANDASTTKVDVNSDDAVKSDALGPMIINSDGVRILKFHH